MSNKAAYFPQAYRHRASKALASCIPEIQLFLLRASAGRHEAYSTFRKDTNKIRHLLGTGVSGSAAHHSSLPQCDDLLHRRLFFQGMNITPTRSHRRQTRAYSSTLTTPRYDAVPGSCGDQHSPRGRCTFARRQPIRRAYSVHQQWHCLRFYQKRRRLLQRCPICTTAHRRFTTKTS